MSDWSLRPAAPEDAPAIQGLVMETARRGFAAAYAPAVTDLFLQQLSLESMADDCRSAIAVVAESGGRLAGCGFLAGCEIRRMFVHPLHQRAGIGRAILSRLMAAARERGLALVALHAAIVSEAFYRKQGFFGWGRKELPLPEHHVFPFTPMAQALAAPGTPVWNLEGRRFQAWPPSDSPDRVAMRQSGPLLLGCLSHPSLAYAEVLGVVEEFRIHLQYFQLNHQQQIASGAAQGIIGTEDQRIQIDFPEPWGFTRIASLRETA